MRSIHIMIASVTILACACNGSNSSDTQDTTKASVDSSSADHTSTMASSDTNNVKLVMVDKKDSTFAVKAAAGGMAEVAMGKLAQTAAQSQRVKDFGAMMVREHSEGNDRLKQLASQKKITLPVTLSDEDQKHLDQLSKKSGSDFDHEYMSMMVKDHKDDIKEFKNAGSDCKDSDLKNFALTSLPMLEKHLDSAMAITKK